MKKQVSLIEHIIYYLLSIVDIGLYLISKNYFLFLWVFHFLSPVTLEAISKLYAKRAYYRASTRVPAYQEFLALCVSDHVPETSKDNYVKKFSIEDRCLGGKIPSRLVAIDESSGSTGTPYNWVRTYKERKQSHTSIRHFAKYCFNKEADIVINAFSLGSWATGMNMGAALERDFIVKNTGPDIQKIFHTLKYFGHQYKYLILGYPPFIKYLIDTAQLEGFPIERFHLIALVGGEGMSEGLRDYLSPYFKQVYSGYGATDIEIGVAGETPLSVALRRLARSDNKVREQLFGNDSRLPMLFQYNPLIHFIEQNENGELIFTINRASRLSPRIRYNLHDEGGIARFDEIANTLAKLGIDISKITQSANPIIKLPFMWIYGRRDYTISVMGANIYPEDIEQIIYEDLELAKITHSFCQALEEINDDVRPAFYFEVNINPTAILERIFKQAIIDGLLRLNADFKEAWKEHPGTLDPKIYLYSQGEGPFKMKTGQIKQIRML